VKKILFIAMLTAFVVSCASKRAAIVDSTITEAKTLKALAEAGNVAVPANVGSLITDAEKQQEERQTEKAFVLADEAVLQLQMTLLKQEQTALGTLKKEAESDLVASKDSLESYQSVWESLRNAPKEHVIN
jgi:hypothetical protein